ncbi:MAG: hypothetical protein J5884_04810 [Paludibacteraceae bacterium]|nr:hypothetical protein [Paludibacteraceae bacterium]
MSEVTEDKAQSEREQYVRAWNETMIKIWQERITLLEVIDTSRLLQSVSALPIRADGRFFEMTISEQFVEYGLWQDYGTGRETPRGNKGDIGRTKVRQRRPWFSKKYYSSVLNLRDFLGENIGREFQGIMADTFERINRL